MVDTRKQDGKKTVDKTQNPGVKDRSGQYSKQGQQDRSCQDLEQEGKNTLQIILEICILELELAKTRSQILFIYFQSHS